MALNRGFMHNLNKSIEKKTKTVRMGQGMWIDFACQETKCD